MLPMDPSRHHDSLYDMEHGDDEALSHEQMKDLLRGAENRMNTRIISRSSDEDVRLLEDHPPAQNIPKINDGAAIAPYIASINGIAQSDPSRAQNGREDKLSSPLRDLRAPIQRKRDRSKGKKATAGPDWYHLPKTNLTAELKRDLQLMKMRGVLDPKRHYKTDTSKNIVPEFSQVGSIVEGPTDFFSSRVTRKQRKKTFIEEILGDQQLTDHFGAKYNSIQTRKSSGKKAFYQKVKERRHREGHKGKR